MKHREYYFIYSKYGMTHGLVIGILAESSKELETAAGGASVSKKTFSKLEVVDIAHQTSKKSGSPAVDDESSSIDSVWRSFCSQKIFWGSAVCYKHYSLGFLQLLFCFDRNFHLTLVRPVDR